MNYIIALIFSLILLGCYGWLEESPSFQSLFIGGLIYIGIGCFHLHKSWHFLNLLEQVSQMGNADAIVKIKRVVKDETLIDNLAKLFLSAIITVGMFGSGYYYMPLAFIGWTGSLIFMLNAQDVRNSIRNLLVEEEKQEEIE